MGEVFAGRYELVDPIGRGGVGAVWRAWDHRRRRYVAAKVLQQSDAHSLLRFVREQALRIDHPHVLAPTSWAADDDKVLFTMDLIGGGSLAHVIGDYGPLPAPYVCTLLDQLLAGLTAVHAEGVVHRDIKPANVLLEATGTGRPHLRLSDFGIAMRKGEPRLTETNYVVGTPGYFAPEQMLGAEPDFPADLFAVGLVALYLLEGAKPDAKALIQHFAEHGTPSAPRGVPEPLWQVVAGLLKPDPESRFRTATGARKALASAAELLPEPGPDDELVEIFDQLGPLPSEFGPDGPLRPKPLRAADAPPAADTGTGPHTGFGNGSGLTNPTGTPGHPGPAPSTPPPPAAAPPIPPVPPVPSMAPTPASASGPAPDQAPPPAPGTPGTPGAPAPVAPASGAPASGTPAPGPASEQTPPLSPSDTGSFRLPPPPAPHQDAPPGPRPTPTPTSTPPSTPTPTPTPPRPGTPPVCPPTPPPPTAQPPAPGSTPVPTPVPTPVRTPEATPSQAPADAPNSQDTFQPPGRLPPEETTQSPARKGASSRPTHRKRRRPGPPRKVAVPVLLLALACYAVGFWALTQI